MKQFPSPFSSGMCTLTRAFTEHIVCLCLCRDTFASARSLPLSLFHPLRLHEDKDREGARDLKGPQMRWGREQDWAFTRAEKGKMWLSTYRMPLDGAAAGLFIAPESLIQ